MTTMQDKALDKFWPQLTFPLSYSEALGTLSKQQLTNIRTNLQISNLSSLNKQGLVEKLSEKIPAHLAEVTRFFDQNRIKLLQRIVKSGGIWDKPLLELQQYEYFRERGILFPATVDGKHVLLMPTELLAYLQEEDLFRDHPIINRNTEWIQLSQGLVFYYGALTVDKLKSFIITEADHKLAVYDLMNIIIDAQFYYEKVIVNEDMTVSNVWAENPQEIIAEQMRRHDLDFCPFTKQQLLKAGEPDYVERTSQFMKLCRYVLERYEIDREEAELMAEECVDATKNGQSLAAIMEVMQDFIEIPNEQVLTELTNLVVPLMNSTKQWLIKGYSPEELSAKRERASLVLNHNVSRPVQADVIDLQTKKKVGRNDPCPCGSGKKFKKCCG